MKLSSLLRRLSLVPFTQWPALAARKGQSNLFSAYERWIELPSRKRPPGNGAGERAPLRLFHSDVFDSSFAQRFQETFPEETKVLLASAERTLRLEWDVLGSGVVDLKKIEKNGLIPWHLDIKTMRGWDPALFYTDIRSGTMAGMDMKVPWEMSRGTNLLRLGQAFRLTGEDRFFEGLVTQLSDWITKNPYLKGVNWKSPMEAAIRASNWCAAMELVQNHSKLTPAIQQSILGSLEQHGVFIRRHLEWNASVSTNHLLSNLLGLAVLGIVLGRMEWLSASLRGFEKEIRVQVDDQGWDYEGSTAYHRFALEIFFFAALLVRRSGRWNMSPLFEERLVKMTERLAELSGPEKRFPLIGDNDSGRIYSLYPREDDESSPWPFLAALLTGRAIETEPGSTPSEAAWLFGWENFGCWNGKGSPVSSPTAAPGWRVLKGPLDTLIFCAASTGTAGFGNHTHNDKLSFTLRVKGDFFLVDPGNLVYSSDPEMRNRFRSTASHSTVEVDGGEQNDFIDGDLFTLKDQSEVVMEEEVPGQILQARHTGYMKLLDPVLHRRRVERTDHPLGWIVTDELVGKTRHSLGWTFVLGPRIRVEKLSATEFLLVGEEGRLKMSLGFPSAEAAIQEGLFSPAYGVAMPSKTIKIRLAATLPLREQFKFVYEGIS